jgi:Anaerobic ribonucleoside-triphosphate reductase
MNDATLGDFTEDATELSDEERQRCEIWTRVMGYHRPVASFNIGKKGEHCERRFFREPLEEREARAEGRTAQQHSLSPFAGKALG